MMIKLLQKFKMLFAKQKINVIPFTIKKGTTLQIYAIIIKTILINDKPEVVWSKMSYFDENTMSWLWENNNKPVDKDEKVRGVKSIETFIKNKISVEYLLN